MLATAPVRRPKPRRRFHPEVLTDTEVRALMDACGKSATGLRNRALIAILYRSGLRIREALELRPKDLDLGLPVGTVGGHGGAVRVLAGKGGTSRTSGLDPGGAAVVAGWLEVRACHGITGLSPVFSTLEGNRLTEAYVRRLLPRLARKAGIEKRVHAHGLRHTHAAQLREEGVDIGVISKQLGHRSIATTARYLDHIAPVKVVEAIGARCW